MLNIHNVKVNETVAIPTLLTQEMNVTPLAGFFPLGGEELLP